MRKFVWGWGMLLGCGMLWPGRSLGEPRQASGTAGSAELRRFSFDEEGSGLPPGFEAVSGQWSRRSETVRDKRNGFISLVGNSSDGNFKFLIFGQGGTQSRYALQSRLRLEKINQWAGVLVRYQGPSQWAALFLSPSQKAVQLIETRGGQSRVLQSAAANIETGQWHRIQVSSLEGRLLCSLNGQKLFEHKGGFLQAAGQVGFIASGGGAADFDHFSFREISK